ncbi:GNAT family N-acetyltransferase [Ideonella sp. A 288]|uniref:GNAT family N-acetyltransferase n=1 Tax=Ideonella sp. A 288 TaxID=1962181 RepID=UPI000B4B8884|nr:GNAT family N-acetyltransferase [Ideonella sp. A 288]
MASHDPHRADDAPGALPPDAADAAAELGPTLRPLGADEADAASALVQAGFDHLVASTWSAEACVRFHHETSPAALREALATPALALGAFDAGVLLGVLLMRQPVRLDLLFVDPTALRRGIARRMWEQARQQLEARFPQVTTVELNATRPALPFYRSVGFVPISREFERGGCRATRMACWLPGRALGAEL